MYERLKQICKEKGTTVTELCAQATGSSGNLATWKKGYMRSDYLLNCARILGVSTDYILGIEERKESKMIRNIGETTFYSYVKNKLSENNKNWETVLTPLEYSKKVVTLYEYGLFPSDTVIHFISKEINVHPQNLFDRIDKSYQISYEVEKAVSSCDNLTTIQQNALMCFLSSIESLGDDEPIYERIPLDKVGRDIVRMYKEVSSDGQLEMYRSVVEIYNRIYKNSVGEPEDVAN